MHICMCDGGFWLCCGQRNFQKGKAILSVKVEKSVGVPSIWFLTPNRPGK